MKRITIAIAVESPLIFLGIKQLFAKDPQLDILCSAEDGEEVRKILLEFNPDILLFSLNLPGGLIDSAIDFIGKNKLKTKVLVLGNSEYCPQVSGIQRAAGYIAKTADTNTLIHAIASIVKGEKWFNHIVLDDLPMNNLPPLDEREEQILHFLAQGMDNTKIAERLCLAKQTIHNYMSALYKKLNVSSRSEAIILAQKSGFGISVEPFDDGQSSE
jgi:DNA-binding NarL/FixJ family response regulator